MTQDETTFFAAWKERLKGHARGLDDDGGHDVFYRRVRADVEILEADDLCALAKHHGASEIAIATRGAEWALTDAYMRAHRPFRMNATRVAEIEALCAKCEAFDRGDKAQYAEYGPQLVTLIRTLLKERKGLL